MERRIHAQPDHVAVLPGRMGLCNGRPQGEANDLMIHFGYETEFGVGIEKLNHLEFIPGAVHVGYLFCAEEFFAEMKNLCQIIDLHETNFYIRAL
jgi:hypothetical protein